MSDLIIHDFTKRELESFIKNPAHAIGLEAPNGTGKTALARQLIADMLDVDEPKLHNYAYFLHIEPTGASISIDSIRQVQHFLELKTIGPKSLQRAVLIEHAESLTTEAQNALLKTLEEPPADTVIVLTVSSSKSLLPTVTSRLQIVNIKQPTKEQLKTFFKDTASDSGFEQTYLLAGGLPGLMVAISSGEQKHPLLESTSRAKGLLQATKYERLIMVDELTKSKDDALNLLQALSGIAYIALGKAAKRHEEQAVKRWQQILTVAYDSHQALKSSVQAKIVLTNLMLNL